MIQVLVERCIGDLDQRAFALLRAGAATMPAAASSGKKVNEKAREKVALRALETFIDGFDGYLRAHKGHCLLATLALTQPGLLTPLPQQHLGIWLQLLNSSFQQLGYKPKRARRAAHALLARLYGSLTLTAMGSGYSTQQACEFLKKDLRKSQHQKRT